MNRLKHNKRWLFGLCLWVILFTPKAFAQNEQDLFIDELQILEIENRMLDLYDQLNEVSTKIPQYDTPDKLTDIDQQVTTIDTKWNAYYQLKQAEIAEDDSLLQIVAEYQLTKQNILDSIANKIHLYDVQKEFTDAETFIFSEDCIYEQLYNTAFEYSLIKMLDPELEKVKGKEQLLAAEAQNQYENAKKLSQEINSLQPRFQKIEEKYIELKITSEKIQALKYQPLLQRIKDYLYSIAAVAMIFMFINVVQAKIKTLKQARENAKKMKQMMNNEENEYPTI